MEENFSPSHDMAEYMSSYWKLVKLLGEQDSSGDMDSYWRRWVNAVTNKCQKKEDSISKQMTDQPTLKIKQFNISLILLQFQQHFYLVFYDLS